MNPETPSFNLSSFIQKHTATCSLCIDAMREMEAYVATSGDWPEGTHGIIEYQLRSLARAIKGLEDQEELPF